ncbi:hypothetical protein IWQ56_001170 [Coemansia nantahalensis]|uniref:Uncharacterized protein n=1 Tax=Coemansia nantahalensis TaxID=2789366 RepID=A0ACC1K129_9FUNG|nr:hypothetical protein IWQ57_002455 [Coemansia nantahalensis]KAJ2772952.1 hypothetical protein IWQ56_001170 [Coemansia nantahalensis]
MGGEYEYGVVPGALKLKKGALTKKPSKKPAKKPSKKWKSSKRAAPGEQAAPATTGEEHPESASGSEQPPRAPTAAERRFEEMRRKRTLERIEKLAEKPYRERIKEFNEQLEREPEQHDMPRVGS